MRRVATPLLALAAMLSCATVAQAHIQVTRQRSLRETR